jgi:hypothetical protein
MPVRSPSRSALAGNVLAIQRLADGPPIQTARFEDVTVTAFGSAERLAAAGYYPVGDLVNTEYWAPRIVYARIVFVGDRMEDHTFIDNNGNPRSVRPFIQLLVSPWAPDLGYRVKHKDMVSYARFEPWTELLDWKCLKLRIVDQGMPEYNLPQDRSGIGSDVQFKWRVVRQFLATRFSGGNRPDDLPVADEALDRYRPMAPGETMVVD